MKRFCKTIGFCLRSIPILLTLLFAIPTLGQPLPPDVGLIIQSTGEVIYWNEGYQKHPGKVQAFMKIRQGDYLKLSSGAAIQMVYFKSGRQETWKGPVVFLVGEIESHIEGDKQVQPEVVFLPEEAYRGLRRIPVVVRRARLSRSGGMMLRGGTDAFPKKIVPTKEEREEITLAKENYQKMRKQAKGDDLTPELNLLGILADYEEYEEMGRVLQEALKIQPNHPVLRELEEWVNSQKISPAKR